MLLALRILKAVNCSSLRFLVDTFSSTSLRVISNANETDHEDFS